MPENAGFSVNVDGELVEVVHTVFRIISSPPQKIGDDVLIAFGLCNGVQEKKVRYLSAGGMFEANTYLVDLEEKTAIRYDAPIPGFTNA